MPEPAPVEVTNIVKTEPANPEATAPPSTAQTTTKTEKVEVITGPPVQPPPPQVVADDAIRTELARYTIASDFFTCIAILVLLFVYGNSLSKDVLAIIGTIIGSIIGYRARDTATVMGYEFGSSSGSTAKSAAAKDKI